MTSIPATAGLQLIASKGPTITVYGEGRHSVGRTQLNLWANRRLVCCSGMFQAPGRVALCNDNEQ